jgi:hypothetical protein
MCWGSSYWDVFYRFEIDYYLFIIDYCNLVINLVIVLFWSDIIFGLLIYLICYLNLWEY